MYVRYLEWKRGSKFIDPIEISRLISATRKRAKRYNFAIVLPQESINIVDLQKCIIAIEMQLLYDL